MPNDETFVLTVGKTTATISRLGALVTDFKHDGSMILFPKQTFTLSDGAEKVRGGCHVCLPNFGPGGMSGQPQHGVARVSQWQLVARSVDTVTLSLLFENDGSYDGLQANITYTVSEASLRMQLQVKNNGNVAMPIAPAFHPYFYNQSAQITVDDTTYDTFSCKEAVQILSQPTTVIKTSVGTITAQADNMLQGVVWTDLLDNYVCVEPTQSGFSFAEERNQDMVVLNVGDAWDCSYNIAIQMHI